MARKSKGKRQFKDRKGMGRNEDRVDKRDRYDASDSSGSNGDRLSSLNDLSWYNKYPLILEAGARLPFPYRPGMSISRGRVQFGSVTQEQGDVIPGVLSLSWIPSLGYSKSPTDPASIVA